LKIGGLDFRLPIADWGSSWSDQSTIDNLQS
jgi:hypothetical protein